MNIETFFGENGPLAQKFEGYKPRPQQIELAKKIEESLLSGSPLLGEAPTGVGKSLAALVPAFRLIKREDAPVVVVTSSILLQEQYFYKDIPLLEDIMGMDVSPVLLKGKSNYLCLDKLINNKPTGQNSDQAQEISEILDWSDKTKMGDVSELDFVPTFPVWSEFAITDQHECAGKECPLFHQCHYYTNRRKMQSAKLIICNYHYYFTALKSEGMLPPGIRAVILDEGHEIPGIARDMEEVKYDIFSYQKINKMLAKAQKKMSAIVGDISVADEIGLTPLLQSHQDLFTEVTKYYVEERPKFKERWVIEEYKRKIMNDMGENHISCLKDTIKGLKSYLDSYGIDQSGGDGWKDDYGDEEVDWIFALTRYHEGIEERLHLAERFFGEVKPELPYEVLNWIEESNGQHVVLKSKPFNAAPITGPLFNSGDKVPVMENATPIAISATLSVNNSLGHLRTSLGIVDETNEVMVSSPFNLKDNLLWYLPETIPAGNDPSHLVYALSEMERIINVLDGKTLCLFTSVRSMQAAAHHFAKKLPKHINVVVQGDMTKKRIIEEMKSNPNTVIVATKSFFTGVDIQGKNLSAVLIDKFPFPMIGDPINEYLMSLERGFWRHALPEVVITMKQGFGRLNRTTEDKGVVAVLDGRLATAGYKGRIFNSFDFEVTATRNFDVVKNYLEEYIC